MSGAEYLLFILMLSIFLGFELINKVPCHAAYPTDVGCQCHLGHYGGRCGCTGRQRVMKTWPCGWVLVP